MSFLQSTEFDFQMLGMGYTLSMSDEDILDVSDVCDISRWEDEGGAPILYSTESHNSQSIN